ncbi:lysophospholipase [Actinomycetes bacterium]|nr:lysophospholipase [Actinomycetes bacterium]
MRRSIIALVSLLSLTACSGGSSGTTSETPTTDVGSSEPPAETTTTLATPTSIVAPYTSEIYSDPMHWTCRPDVTDTCDDDTSVTMINADGTTEVATFTPDPDAPVDCFYAYPTSSDDLTMNSDLIAGREKEVVYQQVARLSSVCRMFAPTYRSVTLAGLFNPPAGVDRASAWMIPFEDIKDAWNHYLANDNQGRGVILLGHSQGTGQLIRLLKEVIDPSEAQRSVLISAIMLGGAVAVPEGEDIGAAMQNIPLCRSNDQTGCIITYASFRDTAPPPANAYFGKPGGMGQPSPEGEMAGCTNPAALGGGTGVLKSAFVTADWAFTDPALTASITTPFMGFPDLLEAECVYANGFSYLEVHTNADPTDARADSFKGDLSPEWGTHAVDWEIASLSILDVVKEEIATWKKAH